MKSLRIYKEGLEIIDYKDFNKDNISDKEVSYSLIKSLLECGIQGAIDYVYDLAERKESREMGKFYHSLLLDTEPQFKVKILPSERGYSSITTETSKKWILENAGADDIVLTQNQITLINEMKNVLYRNKELVNLIGNSKCEQLIEGTILDYKCKGFYDIYNEKNNTIYDLKTMASVCNYDNCNKASLNYAIQVYMYSEMLSLFDIRPDFVFIFQEKIEPYNVMLLQANEDLYDYGKYLFNKIINNLESWQWDSDNVILCKYLQTDSQTLSNIQLTNVPNWVWSKNNVY